MKSAIPILCLFLASCTIYKVEPSKDFSYKKIHAAPSDDIATEKINLYPQGFQCFEPMLFALTLGLVPVHCTDDYRVVAQGEYVGSARVVIMSGWIPMFMGILPAWKYGEKTNLVEDLKEISEVEK